MAEAVHPVHSHTAPQHYVEIEASGCAPGALAVLSGYRQRMQPLLPAVLSGALVRFQSATVADPGHRQPDLRVNARGPRLSPTQTSWQGR